MAERKNGAKYKKKQFCTKEGKQQQENDSNAEERDCGTEKGKVGRPRKRIIRNRKESKIQEMKDSLSGRKSWSGWCLLCPF